MSARRFHIRLVKHVIRGGWKRADQLSRDISGHSTNCTTYNITHTGKNARIATCVTTPKPLAFQSPLPPPGSRFSYPTHIKTIPKLHRIPSPSPHPPLPSLRTIRLRKQAPSPPSHPGQHTLQCLHPTRAQQLPHQKICSRGDDEAGQQEVHEDEE